MKVTRILSILALVAIFAAASVTFAAKSGDVHSTSMFHGPKANTGTAMHYVDNGKSMLKVSPDFKVPDTPAPTWRVVDSSGNIYTLDAFKIKGGEKREVVVPAYVHDSRQSAGLLRVRRGSSRRGELFLTREIAGILSPPSGARRLSSRGPRFS